MRGRYSAASPHLPRFLRQRLARLEERLETAEHVHPAACNALRGLRSAFELVVGHRKSRDAAFLLVDLPRHPARRFLLDRLFARDGRTLTELASELEMTRFGVMKHLRILEDAGLVVARRSGREKLHFLNPVPIRLIHDRWIDKYTERQVSALADLKHELKGETA